MRYWVLAEIPYTGTDPVGSTEAIREELVRDLSEPFTEPRIDIGDPEKGTSRITFDIEAKTPLLAVVYSLNMLYVALAQSEQEVDWDTNRAVVRVAPASEAMYMYRISEPLLLPSGYDGPRINWTPTT